MGRSLAVWRVEARLRRENPSWHGAKTGVYLAERWTASHFWNFVRWVLRHGGAKLAAEPNGQQANAHVGHDVDRRAHYVTGIYQGKRLV